MTLRDLINALEDIAADNEGADDAAVWIEALYVDGLNYDTVYSVHIDREGDVIIVTNDAR